MRGDRFDRWFEGMADKYPPLLRWAMQRRWLVVGGAVTGIQAFR